MFLKALSVVLLAIKRGHNFAFYQTFKGFLFISKGFVLGEEGIQSFFSWILDHVEERLVESRPGLFDKVDPSQSEAFLEKVTYSFL